MKRGRHLLSIRVAFVSLAAATLGIGTWKNPEFWQSADRRGDHLFSNEQFASAAKVYREPRRIGSAQYRNGDFEAAAGTFARVPGADGAFNQGNAWLMHGNYDAAIASYNRALGFKPQWQNALDNKTLAEARKKEIFDSGKDADHEVADDSMPDEIVFDGKGENKKGEPDETNGGEVSDEDIRSIWLRRVQTTPGDFLKAKFARQAAEPNQESQIR